MPSYSRVAIRSCVFVLLLAVCLANPSIITIVFNLVVSLVTILTGCGMGIMLVIFLLNIIETNKLHHTKKETLQSFAQSVPLLLDRARLPKKTLSLSYLKTLYHWFYEKASHIFMRIALRLASSPMIAAQSTNVYTHHQYGASQSQGIYEMIRPFGQTPAEMLVSAYGPTSFSTRSSICVSKNIDEIMHRIFEYTYRDYVEIWYGKVSADHGNFHKMVRADYWDVVKSFSERLAKVDTVNLIMNRCIRCILQYMEDLKRTAKSNPNEQKPTFTLHPCLRDNNTELTYLRRICDYVLILTLPPESASITSLRYILREVLASLAILPMAETLCEPDYINQTLLAYLQWRDTTQEEQNRAYAYAATYEDFIKVINECKDTSALQQIRYRIMTEIIHATTISSLKKDQSKAGKARSMDKGELLINRDLKRYINQCQVAKQQCEKQIRLLGGGEYGGKYSSTGRGAESMESQLLSFEEIMNSPIARSFFLKYLKKIGKAPLLNFWNQIDIIKTTNPAGKNLARIVSHVYQTHIISSSSEQLPFELDKTSIKGMQECVMGNKPPDDFFHTQKQVYEIMEKDHYPSFVVSDVYTYQLMPEIIDENIDKHLASSTADLSKAAFGEDHSSDASLRRLHIIEEKLEYKAQALDSLKSVTKADTKVKEQLSRDIQILQTAKWRQQLHIERTNVWWDNMGKWIASIENVQASQTEGPATPIYNIIVHCSGIPFYKTTDDVSGWVVARTLTDFHELHARLKECSPWLKKYSLPKLPMFRLRKLTDKFLSNSRETLDTYLSDVLKDEILSCSQTLFCFLSPGPDDTNLSSNLDEQAGSGGPKFSGNLGGFLKRIPKDMMDRVMNQMSEDEDSEYCSDDDEDSVLARDSVAEPLYLLIGEIFELHGLFRFLRRSLIIFVRVAFGRSINRQVRDTSEWLVSEPMMVFYLQLFLDSMWPDGKLAEQQAPIRTEDEKVQTKLELRVKLLQNIPEALNGLVGQENAKRGVLKVFHALQDKRLNKHLFYNLLAEAMEEVFPEILPSGSADQ